MRAGWSLADCGGLLVVTVVLVCVFVLMVTWMGVGLCASAVLSWVGLIVSWGSALSLQNW